ncbi:hypothetical protein H0H93_000499, partial [Arthromyces matolae]
HRDQRALDEIDSAIDATVAAQKGVIKAAEAAEYLRPVRGRTEQQHSSRNRSPVPPPVPMPPSALSDERYRDESPSPPPPPRQRPTPGVSYVSAPSNYRGSNQGHSGSTSAQQPRRNSQHYQDNRDYRGNDRGNGYRYRRRALDSSSSPTLDHAFSNRNEENLKTDAVKLKGRDLLLD